MSANFYKLVFNHTHTCLSLMFGKMIELESSLKISFTIVWMMRRRSDRSIHKNKLSGQVRYSKNNPHPYLLRKFTLVILLLVIYFLYISWKFGWQQGLTITLLTWSFFVFCTPISDAGIILDLPLRLITGIRMLHAEMMVWFIAGMINLYMLIHNPEVYQSTILLQIFYQILTQPIPYWSVILLSTIGTFLSVMFGDELLDQLTDRTFYHKHKNKHKLIVFIVLILLIIITYEHLITEMGIKIEF